MAKKIIRKVLLHKGTHTLWITIPHDIGIKEGDYVEVKKVI
jgi:hypothetical protein